MRSAWCSPLILVLGTFCGSATAQCAYELQVLPWLPNYGYAIGQDLAADGTVVGFRKVAGGSLLESAFKWHPSTGYVTLPPPPGGAQYWHAYRISDDGLVAGRADVTGISDQYLQMVTWDANGLPTLHPPESPPFSYGIFEAVGDSTVIGTIEFDPSGAYPRPFIMDAGKERPLPPEIADYNQSGFNAGNAWGHAAGYRGTFTPREGSFIEPIIWDGYEGVTVLPSPGPDFPHPQVWALSDDDRAVVVCLKYISEFVKPYRSFLWWNGQYTPIGSHEGSDYQFVSSINDSGQAVGSFGTLGQPGSKGFLWQDGILREFSTLTIVPRNVKLGAGAKIRNDGRILLGVKYGTTQIPLAAILTPLTGDEDVNLDCAINARDLSIVLGAWGDVGFGTPSRADIDHDSLVGPSDLASVLSAWSPTP